MCVGLAADCDAPEHEVEKLVSAGLPGANALPFAGFITPDLKWVAGFSGYKDVTAFASVLDEVDKSPVLNASPDSLKKLDALLAQANKAAEKSDWKAVMAASKSAAELKGRAPQRDKIAEAVTKARSWAAGELTKAV